MAKKLSSKNLGEITKKTLRHYDEMAESFWQGTKNHDVLQNYEAFLLALKSTFLKESSFSILDLGCGPGRDVIYFQKLGHQPIGLDGSPVFCQMARDFSGCPILEQDFLKLNLEPKHFHGVFANASLFHVPRQELPRVLGELRESLKPKGILFSSNPRGDVEGWMGNRYGTYMEFELYKEFLNNAGFEILRHYYRPEENPPDEQPWLAVVSQKK